MVRSAGTAKGRFDNARQELIDRAANDRFKVVLIGKGVGEGDAGGVRIAQVMQKGVAIDHMAHSRDPFTPADVMQQAEDIGAVRIKGGVVLGDQLGGVRNID